MHFCCSYIFAELDENSSKVKNPFIKHENDHDANLVPLSVPWRFWEYPPPHPRKKIWAYQGRCTKMKGILLYLKNLGKKG